MQVGICVPAEKVGEVLDAQPDFIEEHIQNFLKPAEPEGAFAENLARAKALPVPVPAANCFLPASMKCVGPDVNVEALARYAEVAFRRARAVGMERLVFGSGGARKIPDGFPREQAKAQFVALLKRLGPLAAKHQVTIVVEPLNKAECNFINTLAEGAELVRAAAHPNVWLLADIFHMLRDGEPAGEIARFGNLLRHVHLAEKEKRTAPGVMGDDFRPFFAALKQAGYDGRMAIECGWADRPKQSVVAVRTVREQWAEA